MTTHERMRRRGWTPRVKFHHLLSWRHANLSGLLGYIAASGQVAMLGDAGTIYPAYGGERHGVVDLAQRAKAAARRLARRRR